MASMLNDGFYQLQFIREPADSNGVKFVHAWAEDVFQQFSAYIDEPFALMIGECHAGAVVYDWQACMYQTDPKTGLPELDFSQPLTLTNNEQRYIAHCSDSFSESYFGTVVVSVVMPEHGNGRHCPKIAAGLLANLAMMHYYMQISAFYPNWSTHYLDAPVQNWRQLSNIKCLSDLWA